MKRYLSNCVATVMAFVGLLLLSIGDALCNLSQQIFNKNHRKMES